MFEAMRDQARLRVADDREYVRWPCLHDLDPAPRSVVVRINDRGPFRPAGRIIDLSGRAARELGFSGVTRVELALVEPEPVSRAGS